MKHGRPRIALEPDPVIEVFKKDIDRTWTRRRSCGLNFTLETTLGDLDLTR